jgi:hypothetical protein
MNKTFSEDEVLRLAREAYAKGLATFEIVRHRCALLVISMNRHTARSTTRRARTIASAEMTIANPFRSTLSSASCRRRSDDAA